MKQHRITLQKFKYFLQNWQENEWLILSILAVIVGLTAAISIWVFENAIDWVHWLMFEGLGTWLRSLGQWTVFLLPVIGGLVVGLLSQFFIGEERHHGVAGIMEAVALAGGRLRYGRIPAKALAAIFSIGSGASVGPEDPSVQIGANLGSMFGQWLKVSDERMRAVVAGGAAAGIAAAFNAPIAGVFFALEIILGEIASNALGMVLVSAVVSAVFTQAVSGIHPAFVVPSYSFKSAAELPLYLGLGLLTGPIAALYVRVLFRTNDFYTQLPIPRWFKTVTAGIIVGITGIFLPQIFGVGYDTIEASLSPSDGQTIIGLLILLVFAKLIMTAISIGGGFMGGVFAPSLFLGAVFGSAYGTVAALLFPSLNIDPPAFAMVGMAAVLAGAVHAPLTAILLLFEMTNDYRIILPLMFSVAVSLLVSQRLQRDSVYTLSLARKGIRLERGRDVEVLQAITVEEVMLRDGKTLNENDTIETASKVMTESGHHGLPVLNNTGELAGILTLQDIYKATHLDPPLQTVRQAATHNLEVAYPDETIGTAMRRMSTRDIGRLPVVERNNPTHLLGVLRRSELIRAYDVALTRRAVLRHQAQKVRLGAASGEGVRIVDIRVEPDSSVAGKKVREINWPHDCVVASIRRGRKFIIPRGDTVIYANDVLITVAEEGEAQDRLEALCSRGHRIQEPSGLP